jgi:hypothetical protein
MQQRLADGSILKALVIGGMGVPITKVWVETPTKSYRPIDISFPYGLIFIPVRVLDHVLYTENVFDLNPPHDVSWEVYNGSFDNKITIEKKDVDTGSTLSWWDTVDVDSDAPPELYGHSIRATWIVTPREGTWKTTKWTNSNFGNSFWKGEDPKHFDTLSWMGKPIFPIYFVYEELRDDIIARYCTIYHKQKAIYTSFGRFTYETSYFGFDDIRNIPSYIIAASIVHQPETALLVVLRVGTDTLHVYKYRLTKQITDGVLHYVVLYSTEELVATFDEYGPASPINFTPDGASFAYGRDINTAKYVVRFDLGSGFSVTNEVRPVREMLFVPAAVPSTYEVQWADHTDVSPGHMPDWALSPIPFESTGNATMTLVNKKLAELKNARNGVEISAYNYVAHVEHAQGTLTDYDKDAFKAWIQEAHGPDPLPNFELQRTGDWTYRNYDGFNIEGIFTPNYFDYAYINYAAVQVWAEWMWAEPPYRIRSRVVESIVPSDAAYGSIRQMYMTLIDRMCVYALFEHDADFPSNLFIGTSSYSVTFASGFSGLDDWAFIHSGTGNFLQEQVVDAFDTLSYSLPSAWARWSTRTVQPEYKQPLNLCKIGNVADPITGILGLPSDPQMMLACLSVI